MLFARLGAVHRLIYDFFNRIDLLRSGIEVNIYMVLFARFRCSPPTVLEVFYDAARRIC